MLLLGQLNLRMELGKGKPGPNFDLHLDLS